MDIHRTRRLDFVFLQNLHRPITPRPILMFSKISVQSILYAGMIALGLAYLMAHYFSTSLFSLYHDWSGWRTITGNSPNTFTHAVEKISWALVFCSTWWMLWRLDLLISSPPIVATPTPDMPPEPESVYPDEDANKSDPFYQSHKTENFVPEEDASTRQESDQDEEVGADEPKKVIFPTVEELDMAAILSLPKDDLNDFSKIKSTYRIAIAKYHPDKVSALGPEIREVAETKAKEINQAYEFFRKKFNNS
jgi:hypothetical protein